MQKYLKTTIHFYNQRMGAISIVDKRFYFCSWVILVTGIPETAEWLEPITM
jgi:hypothetical protein